MLNCQQRDYDFGLTGAWCICRERIAHVPSLGHPELSTTGLRVWRDWSVVYFYERIADVPCLGHAVV
jgi:hypothetical protein